MSSMAGEAFLNWREMMPGTGGGVSGGPIDLSSAIPEAPRTAKIYELKIGGITYHLGELSDDNEARTKAEHYVRQQRENYKNPMPSDWPVNGVLREVRNIEWYTIYAPNTER